MIDFQAITKTLGGLDCYYIGQRESFGQVLHRFAVVNDQGETFHYYDAEGRRIIYSVNRWIESPSRMFNIFESKRMKTVEIVIESIIKDKLIELRTRYKTIGDAVFDTAAASYQMRTEHASIRACIALLEQIIREANNA